MPNAPKKAQPTNSRVLAANNATRKNLVRSGRNVANMFNNNENVEVVNFNANYTPEAPQGLIRAGLVTPQRPTRSVFGKVGALPSNAPPAPRKLFRRTKTRKTRSK